MPLKIGYFAHGPWAHLALDKLLGDSAFDICFIATRVVGDHVLQDAAEKANIPFLMPKRVNDPDEMAQLGSYGADLFVSMSFDQIFRQPLIDLPPMGVINCHAGALPFYRGRNILNWALINGETQFGVTAHYMDTGIDTGPIIRQDFVPVVDDDDYGTLLGKAYVQCAQTLHAALLDVANGKQSTLQHEIHPVGFYCGQRKAGDEWLDWQAVSSDIHNFVRGITSPGPCARTWLNGQEVTIVRTEKVANAIPYIGTVGEVVGRDERGIIVKTGDTVIRISLMASVADLAASFIPSYPIGTRFTSQAEAKYESLQARIAQLEAQIKKQEG